ncbi:hypothetical protein MKK70_21200 [Methylobacterium sp. E-041]|uniref:hypothetical protein n=1 Tax=Methylobacterium sp. E-041 TaxID=2836573 RepID=UPI001FB9FF46|nr:hypothetical protein [Methylobacterium sp. E-041]MCJ2107847.1 hypothetical protein [Methylobacterium sp. E-041]
MSSGYGPPRVDFSSLANIGKSFSSDIDGIIQARNEREAPDLIAKLIGGYQGGAQPPPVAAATDVASPRLPSFAATGGGAGDYLATMRAKESGGNDDAKNPNSSATGRYQFTTDTWNGLARKYPDLGLTPNGRSDPAQQERAAQAFTNDNAKALTSAGIPITPGNLYVSHFLGEAGGPKFIAGAMSNPDAPAVAFVSPGAARANRSIFFDADGRPKTAGAVYAERTSRFGGGGAPVAQASAGPRTAPVAIANNEAETQALEQRMGMMPATRTAAAPTPDTDEADTPVANAQPAGFQIPGQPAPQAAPVAAPAPAAPAGFAGFGSTASRMGPEQAAALQAAWKNPVTRPMATQIYGEMLKGQASPWKLQQMGDQPVLFNERTAQIVPVGAGKRQTATVGNAIVDTATGQPIYQAPEKPMVVGGALVNPDGRVVYEGKDDKFTYQSMPGVGMVALHPTDPDKSRVIIQGQQPRPLTADERSAYGIPAGQAGGMGADGKPFGIGGGKTEVNVDTKGAGKFSEKANEIQAKRYGEMVDAADNAVPLRADIDTMADLAAKLNTGKLAEARLGLAQYAKEAGFDSIASSLTGGKMGEMEAFTALADKLTPRMRVPGSGSTSDSEGRAFRNSLPSLLKTPGGNAMIADTFKGLADYQAQVGEIAGKALRGEISQAEADQGIRSLASPYARFKEYRAAQGGSAPSGSAPAPAVAKGPDRLPLPEGYSGARAVAEGKAAIAAGKDRAGVAEKLRRYGIDPARLD